MSKDLKDYSKDAFFHIPPASACDFTGFAPYLPDDEEARNLSKLMDVPATGANNPNETVKDVETCRILSNFKSSGA